MSEDKTFSNTKGAVFQISVVRLTTEIILVNTLSMISGKQHLLDIENLFSSDMKPSPNYSKSCKTQFKG